MEIFKFKKTTRLSYHIIPFRIANFLLQFLFFLFQFIYQSNNKYKKYTIERRS